MLRCRGNSGFRCLRTMATTVHSDSGIPSDCSNVQAACPESTEGSMLTLCSRRFMRAAVPVLPVIPKVPRLRSVQSLTAVQRFKNLKSYEKHRGICVRGIARISRRKHDPVSTVLWQENLAGTSGRRTRHVIKATSIFINRRFGCVARRFSLTPPAVPSPLKP